MKLSITLIAFLLFINSGKAQIALGQSAPDISLPNANDSIVHLSSLKGKVVLIDFWASWCEPCRQSNPQTARLYKKYKEQGLEVVGVSIDNKKQEWLQAVKSDKLSFIQVNDDNGWAAPVANDYGVNEIPSTFLVNKEGKIIAIDADGNNLDKEIKEALK